MLWTSFQDGKDSDVRTAESSTLSCFCRGAPRVCAVGQGIKIGQVGVFDRNVTVRGACAIISHFDSSQHIDPAPSASRMDSSIFSTC